MTKTERVKCVRDLIKGRGKELESIAGDLDLSERDLYMLVAGGFESFRPDGYKLTTASGRVVREALSNF